MSAPFQSAEEYELEHRFSIGSERIPDFNEAHRLQLLRFIGSTAEYRYRYQQLVRRKSRTLVPLWARILLCTLLACILMTAILFPSYTRVPPHYHALRDRVESSKTQHGLGNPRNEKVFIAAVLYDPQGDLAAGPWGRALLRLIELLGEQNVFLSIYENNSGENGETALQALTSQVSCNHSIVSQPGLDLNGLSRVVLPGGEKRIRRIDYLSAIRNRALFPLEQQNVEGIYYDKLLYLNDVIFDPVEALQLLFCTNADAHGIAQYRAACAVDFSNAFKFYDTYAMRDLEGYEIGMPFYPWFTSAGNAQSRQDVLSGRDAVRVRSCWGGMVAFDARFFQGRNPLRFRSGNELFWDASECCLVHADLQQIPSVTETGALTDTDTKPDTGIYMNPFIRVAYDARSHAWLWTTRRIEALYPIMHDILSRLAGYPRANPRRAEIAGQAVHNEVWVADNRDAATPGMGRFQTVERMASNDGFCGRRGLEVLIEDRKPGQDGFEAVPIG
ncbi:cryptococcal mannosyltransferase 1-domain-containing protein [Aspergillus spinulosporus]